jgi:MoaA/NifB/PqqE/SkfB family radical SAM enzyme
MLKIEAEVVGSRVKLESYGPLSPLARPIIDKMNRIFEDERPIANAGREGLVFSTWIPPAPSKAFDRMVHAEVAWLLHRRVPDQFSIAVIRGCPNNCIHCAAPQRKGPSLSQDVIKRAIGEALDMGSYIITFDGGEPMLRPDLPLLVSSVDDRAIAACFTSGYGLTSDLASSLRRAGLYAVRVSIDAPQEKEHDRVRGRLGAFRDAASGVRNALDAGLLVDLFMVVSPSNIDDLDEAYELARSLRVHELSLYEIVAVGRWSSHEDEVLTKSDVGRLERFAKEMNRSDDSAGALPRVTAFPHLLSEDMFGCFAGRRWIHVDASGEALPCAYMPKSFGNIMDRSLADIWEDMSRYPWFKGRCSCQMRDKSFRQAHPELFLGQDIAK